MANRVITANGRLSESLIYLFFRSIPGELHIKMYDNGAFFSSSLGFVLAIEVIVISWLYKITVRTYSRQDKSQAIDR